MGAVRLKQRTVGYKQNATRIVDCSTVDEEEL